MNWNELLARTVSSQTISWLELTGRGREGEEGRTVREEQFDLELAAVSLKSSLIFLSELLSLYFTSFDFCIAFRTSTVSSSFSVVTMLSKQTSEALSPN